MAGIEKANGHSATHLLEVLDPMLAQASRPKPEDLGYDLDATLAAIVGLRAKVPPEAFTAAMLGTERQGNGLLIDETGLVLTIGYLITEASAVTLHLAGGKTVPAHAIAYDYDSGFGLVRAHEAIAAKPLRIADRARLAEGSAAVVASHGGSAFAISAKVVSRREFAGRWEYMIDDAIFTAPPHPAWSGAAMFGPDGTLAGVGSLYVEDAAPGAGRSPGNMFVPAELLPPILGDLLAHGRSGGPKRPYLAMFTVEASGVLVITHVVPNGPAARANLRPGDIVRGVNGRRVATLGAFYRALWGAGTAGVAVTLALVRDGRPREAQVKTADRYEFLRSVKPHH